MNPVKCAKCQLHMLYTGDSTWRCLCCNRHQPVTNGRKCRHDIDPIATRRQYFSYIQKLEQLLEGTL